MASLAEWLRTMMDVATFLGFVPLLLLAGLMTFGVLTGRIAAGGIWRDSFDPDQLSATRVYQSMAVFAAAASVLMGLGQSGYTAFAPLPQWLFVVAGGGNVAYLGAKLAALRKVANSDPMRIG